MEWFYLFLATACEIFGVVIMKELINTKNKLYLLALIVCFGFLSLSMQSIAMSVAYSIWTGAGTAGGVMIGVLFYQRK